MATTTDTDNPAVARNLDLPPALLEAIRDDPEMMQPLARSMAAVMANDLFVARGSMTPPQQQSLMESFAKLGNLNPKDKQAQVQGATFSIQISIPQVGDTPAYTNTLEATATRVDDLDDEEVRVSSILGRLPAERQIHQSGGGAGGVDKNDDLDYQDSE